MINTNEAFKKAKSFLEVKYPELLKNDHWINFDNIYYAKTGTKSIFSKTGFADKYKLKDGFAIRIGCLKKAVSKWYSYARKTPLGFICPIDGISVKPQVGLEITLVHELTHLVQHLLDLKRGELLTTINEQEYVLENCKYLHHKLITYKMRQMQEDLWVASNAHFEKINGDWLYIDHKNPPKLGKGRITSIPPNNWEETHKEITVGTSIYYQEKM